MIVVDTTVWVDFFAGRTEAPHVAELLRLIDEDAGVALTDVVFGEILQGLRSDAAVQRVDTRLRAFEILQLRSLHDFRSAAELYRRARSRGRTIHRTSGTGSFSLICEVMVQLNGTTDYLDAQVQQNSGVSQDVSGDQALTYFEIMRVA